MDVQLYFQARSKARTPCRRDMVEEFSYLCSLPASKHTKARFTLLNHGLSDPLPPTRPRVLLPKSLSEISSQGIN